jgi:hypothetical protein
LSPAEVQAALAAIALDLLRVEDRCREILARLPQSLDEDAMIEGRMAWDLPTELRTTVECFMVDELRLAIESLERVSRVSEDELRREFGKDCSESSH